MVRICQSPQRGKRDRGQLGRLTGKDPRLDRDRGNCHRDFDDFHFKSR